MSKIRFGKFFLAALFALLASVGAHAQCSGYSNSQVYGQVETCTAGSAVNQGQIVSLNASNQVVPIAANATTGALGVALQSGSTGSQILIVVSGQAVVSTDFGCAVGNIVEVGSIAGNAHCLASGPTTQVIGISTGAASTAGSVTVQIGALSSQGPGSVTPSGTSINTINVSGPPYNTPIGNVCASSSVHITSGSNNVTCDTYTFTSADIGKIIFETCCGGAGGSNKATSVLHLAQGVINSLVSAHTVTVCTTTGSCTPVNATNTDNGTSGAIMIFGFDGTSQMQSAISAAYGVTGPCPGIQLPVGVILVSQGLGNSTPLCQAPIGLPGDAGVTVFGQGRASSLIVPEPTFNFSASTGLGTQPGEFFSINGIDRKNFGIWGGEVGACTGAPHSVSMVSATSDDFDWNLGLSGWCATDTAMWGYDMEGPGAYPQFIELDGAGGVGVVVPNAGLGPFNNMVGSYIGDTNGFATGEGNLWVKASATFSCEGCMYGTSSRSGTGIITVDGTFIDSNGVIIPTVAGINGLSVRGTGVGKVTGLRFGASSATNGAIVASGGKLTAMSSSFVGATNAVNNAGGFYDPAPGSNSYTGALVGITPTCTVTGFGTGPTCTVVANSSTNEKGIINITAGTTPGSSGTLTLAFAGNFNGSQNTFCTCIFELGQASTGTWNPRATLIEGASGSISDIQNWDNNAVALTAAAIYQMHYRCTPQ